MNTMSTTAIATRMITAVMASSFYRLPELRDLEDRAFSQIAVRAPCKVEVSQDKVPHLGYSINDIATLESPTLQGLSSNSW